jgi:hypothetical protein
MSDTAKYTVRLADGREFGPAGMELLVQWAEEGRIPRDAMLVPDDQRDPYPAVDEPSLKPHILAPPTRSTGPIEPHEQEGPALIPYKNPAALVGYYLGICSCIPFIGLILGPIAIGLGISGLRKVAKHPQRKGTVHAWIAIILGLMGTAIGVLMLVVMILGILAP